MIKYFIDKLKDKKERKLKSAIRVVAAIEYTYTYGFGSVGLPDYDEFMRKRCDELYLKHVEDK